MRMPLGSVTEPHLRVICHVAGLDGSVPPAVTVLIDEHSQSRASGTPQQSRRRFYAAKSGREIRIAPQIFPAVWSDLALRTLQAPTLIVAGITRGTAKFP